MSKLPPTGESEGYEACPDEVALPAQIECCERERRLTDSKAGMLRANDENIKLKREDSEGDQ